MGLKRDLVALPMIKRLAFNRIKVGLKLSSAIATKCRGATFNRIKVGLKPYYAVTGQLVDTVF